MLDRDINPQTRDYIADGTGGTRTTASAAPAVYHAITMRRGSLATRPNDGSRLHELQYAVPEAAPLAAELAELALQKLIDQGRLSDVQVDAAVTNGQLVLNIAATDTAGPLAITMEIAP